MDKAKLLKAAKAGAKIALIAKDVAEIVTLFI